MTKFNRRRFLTSLAATTACAGAAPSPTRAEAIARPHDLSGFDEEIDRFRRDYWFLKRETDPSLNAALREAGRPAIDFWSRECCDVSHAEYLPPEIPTGVICYDPMGDTRLDRREAFEQSIQHIESIHTKSRPNAANQLAVHRDGIETLSSTLRAMIHNEPSEAHHSRTALIALDSLGPSRIDQGWSGLLPVFAQCYERIIGLVHSPKRGLRDWADHLNCVFPNNAKSYFEESVWDTASQCDVVIVTSAGLLETDPGLCASATTEMLVGELIRRFGCATLDQGFDDSFLDCLFRHVSSKPLLLALGSVTLAAPHREISEINRILKRQQRLVSGSFGKSGGDRTDFFAMAIASGHELGPADNRWWVFSDSAEHHRAYILSTLPPTQKTANAACRCDGALDLITLWPFEFDSDACHVFT